jgi:hypothetical protein
LARAFVHLLAVALALAVWALAMTALVTAMLSAPQVASAANRASARPSPLV